MSQGDFQSKWAAIRAGGKQSNLEEPCIYVEPEQVPRTQRQLSLYHYFRFIRERLERLPARRVLEIGCGRGTIGLYCATYAGLDVTFMDNEENAIAIAREACEKRGVSAEFVVGDAVHTTFADGSFDAVVSIGLAEHFDNVEELLAEQYRLLKPGGVMISLNIPKKFSVQELNVLMRSLKKLAGRYPGDVKRDYYRNDYPARQYEQMAQSVGFERTEVTHVCPFPIYVPVSVRTDRWVTGIRRLILRLRSMWMPYPYRTNALLAHAHFLVGYKPGPVSRG